MLKLVNSLKHYCYSNIRLEINGQKQAAFLTLTNSKKRNPLSIQTILEIRAALEEVESKSQQEQLKILVLKGEGPVFSAGHNLIEMRSIDSPEKIFKECNKTMVMLKRFPLITLCSVDNVATAAGFQLALSCDLILATKAASFGILGMKKGLFPSTPLVQLERSLKSECIKTEIVMLGDMLSADEAYAHGLINKVVQNDQLEEQVNKYIEKARHLSGQVISLGKRVLSKQVSLQLEQAYCVAVEGMRQNILESEDCRQGLTAFGQKRHPKFNK